MNTVHLVWAYEFQIEYKAKHAFIKAKILKNGKNANATA